MRQPLIRISFAGRCVYSFASSELADMQHANRVPKGADRTRRVVRYAPIVRGWSRVVKYVTRVERLVKYAPIVGRRRDLLLPRSASRACRATLGLSKCRYTLLWIIQGLETSCR